MFKACVICRCLKEEDSFKLKTNGQYAKVCMDCKANNERRYKCEHSRFKRQCRNCDLYSYLSQIMRVHNRRVCGNCRNLNEHLGCTISDLKQWIECFFTNEMNWENYATVREIDHMNPLRDGDYEERVTKLHFTNIKPRFIADNRTGRPRIN